MILAYVMEVDPKRLSIGDQLWRVKSTAATKFPSAELKVFEEGKSYRGRALAARRMGCQFLRATMTADAVIVPSLDIPFHSIREAAIILQDARNRGTPWIICEYGNESLDTSTKFGELAIYNMGALQNAFHLQQEHTAFAGSELRGKRYKPAPSGFAFVQHGKSYEKIPCPFAVVAAMRVFKMRRFRCRWSTILQRAQEEQWIRKKYSLVYWSERWQVLTRDYTFTKSYCKFLYSRKDFRAVSTAGWGKSWTSIGRVGERQAVMAYAQDMAEFFATVIRAKETDNSLFKVRDHARSLGGPLNLPRRQDKAVAVPQIGGGGHDEFRGEG